MTIDNKEVVFNGGPFQSYWWADEHEPIHPAIKAELTDAVAPDLLEKAWEDTKKVYPLIDLVPDDYDEEVVFFKGEGISKPIKSKNTLQLAKEATLYRGFSLTYFQNVITLSAYHSLVDEKGLNEIFRTLMNFYISYYADMPKAAEGVMMKENRQPEEYYIQNTVLQTKEHKPQTVKLYKDIREIFNDSNISADENAAATVGKLDIPFKAYSDMCRKYGVGFDELFIYAMARTVYAMYPKERKKLCFGVMTDFRDTFGVRDTVAPCSKKMPVILSYDDVNGCDIKAALANIAEMRAYQKSDDYIRSHVALENTYSVLNIRNACLSVNFSGEFDIGGKTSYIKDITMSDYSMRSVFMIRLGDIIKVSLQYGTATGKYMDAVSKTLNELDIKASTAAEPYPVKAEAEEPII